MGGAFGRRCSRGLSRKSDRVVGRMRGAISSLLSVCAGA